MHLPDGLRIIRGAAVATAAVLVVGGAAFAAQTVVAPRPATTLSLPGDAPTGPGAGSTLRLRLAGVATQTPDPTETPDPTDTPDATERPEGGDSGTQATPDGTSGGQEDRGGTSPTSAPSSGDGPGGQGGD